MEIARALTCRVSDLIETAENGRSSALIRHEDDLMATTGALELLQDYARIREPRLRQALIKVAGSLSGEDTTEPEGLSSSVAPDARQKGVRTRWRRRG